MKDRVNGRMGKWRDARIETTERFHLAVRKDVVDRARPASEASRKGNSVARGLRERAKEKAPKRK